MDIQLIAFDLDGTTLQPDHVSFTPRLEAALAEAHRRGIAILPVTGRQYGLLPPPLRAHPAWEDLCVLCDGAEVRRLATGAVLSAHYLSAQALLPLLEVTAELDLPVEFSSDSTLYLTPRDLARQNASDGLTFHKTVLAAHSKTVEDLGVYALRTEMQVEKVNLPLIPPACREELTARLAALPYSAVWVSLTGIEVTHPAATKGGGLLEACRMLNIPLARAMAIGDSGNDQSMLLAAGWGVAMGNAPASLRRIAKAVTAPYDADGAALAIERYALSPT